MKKISAHLITLVDISSEQNQAKILYSFSLVFRLRNCRATGLWYEPTAHIKDLSMIFVRIQFSLVPYFLKHETNDIIYYTLRVTSWCARTTHRVVNKSCGRHNPCKLITIGPTGQNKIELSTFCVSYKFVY